MTDQFQKGNKKSQPRQAAAKAQDKQILQRQNSQGENTLKRRPFSASKPTIFDSNQPQIQGQNENTTKNSCNMIPSNRNIEKPTIKQNQCMQIYKYSNIKQAPLKTITLNNQTSIVQNLSSESKSKCPENTIFSFPKIKFTIGNSSSQTVTFNKKEQQQATLQSSKQSLQNEQKHNPTRQQQKNESIASRFAQQYNKIKYSQIISFSYCSSNANKQSLDSQNQLSTIQQKSMDKDKKLQILTTIKSQSIIQDKIQANNSKEDIIRNYAFAENHLTDRRLNYSTERSFYYADERISCQQMPTNDLERLEDKVSSTFCQIFDNSTANFIKEDHQIIIKRDTAKINSKTIKENCPKKRNKEKRQVKFQQNTNEHSIKQFVCQKAKHFFKQVNTIQSIGGQSMGLNSCLDLKFMNGLGSKRIIFKLIDQQV